MGGSEVCSINFEPPDTDLCSACHVYPLSRGACIISILFILNGFTLGGGGRGGGGRITQSDKPFDLQSSNIPVITVNEVPAEREEFRSKEIRFRKKNISRYLNVS